MKWAGSNEPGVPYLSCYPDDYSNDSIFPFLCPRVIVRYFSACNSIENHNRIRQSGLVLDKYLVTHRGDFILCAIVTLGMGITYGELLLCHGCNIKFTLND